jgi:hypothetical protein
MNHVLLSCISHFQKNVHSRKFVVYIIDKVLPRLHEIASENEHEDTQLEILKLFSDMSAFTGDVDNLSERLDKIFTRLMVSHNAVFCPEFTVGPI